MAEYLSKEDINTGEYISRDEALKAMQYCCENCDNYNGAMCRACDNADEMDIICDIPAADVQPVKRGHWIEIDYGMFYEFSECGNVREFERNFCSNCGADMRGDENG